MMSNIRRPAVGLAVVVAAAVAVAASGAPSLAATSPKVAAPTAAIIEHAGSPGAIKDSYIVVLRDVVAKADVPSVAANLAARHTGTVRHVYSTALPGFAVSMTEDRVRQLASDPRVSYVEQDQMMRTSDRQTPPSWGLDRVDQRQNRALVDNAFRWHDSVSGDGVRVYVLDTGIRTTHREFLPDRARTGWDFVDNDPIADDCHGHGTHVAGTVAGTSYGVAKRAHVVAVRVLDCGGSAPVATVVAGVDWVTARAVAPALANMSMSGPPSNALDDAVTASINAGLTYVVAAGNEDDDACNYSPARVPRAITVAATESGSDARARYSNYGPCVDIFAPGSTIRSAWANDDTATAVLDGTSMAAPHVAGTIAQYLDPGPTWTPQQLTDWLIVNATNGVVVAPGVGSPNRLLHSAWWGPVAELTCTSASSSLQCQLVNRDPAAPAWAGQQWRRDGVAVPGWANQTTPSDACVPGTWYKIEVEVANIHTHTDRLSTASMCNA